MSVVLNLIKNGCHRALAIIAAHRYWIFVVPGLYWKMDVYGSSLNNLWMRARPGKPGLKDFISAKRNKMKSIFL